MDAAWNAAGYSYRRRDLIDYEAATESLRIGAVVCKNVATVLVAAKVNCTYYRRSERNGQTLLINGQTVLRTQVIRKRRRFGGMQWFLRKIYKGYFDWILVVRLGEDAVPFDSFLVNRAQYFAMDPWLHDLLPGEWHVQHEIDGIAALVGAIRPALAQA